MEELSLYYIPTYPHTPHHIPVWCGSGGRTVSILHTHIPSYPTPHTCLVWKWWKNCLYTTYPHTLIPHTTYLFGVEVVEELSLYYTPTYPHTPHHIPVWCGSGGRTPHEGLYTTYPHTLIPHTTYLFGVEVVEELPLRVSVLHTHIPSYPTPHTCLVWKWWKNCLCTTHPHTLIPHTTYLFGVEVVEELPMRVSILHTHIPSYPTPHTCLVWKWWKNSP